MQTTSTLCRLIVLYSLTITTLLYGKGGDTRTDTNTTVMPYSYTLSLAPQRTPPIHGTLLEDFTFHIGTDSSFGNRFGRYTGLAWTRTMQKQGYGIHDEIAEVGRDVVLKTLENSAREALISHLPIDEWKDWFFGSGAFGRFFENVVEGSIGNTEEENLEYVSAEPSETMINKSWWHETQDDLSLQYGVRPVYGYVMADIGHQHARSLGRKILPIVHVDLRLKLEMPSFQRDGWTRIIKTESQLVFPLPKKCQLSVGGSMYPIQLFGTSHSGANRYSPSVSVRFDQLFTKNEKSVGLFSVGTQIGAHQVLVSAQFAVPWEFLADRIYGRSRN